MLVYTVEEAKLMHCCSMQTNCSADRCMAWTPHYVIDTDAPRPANSSWSMPPLPPKMKQSGMGRCGLVRD